MVERTLDTEDTDNAWANIAIWFFFFKKKAKFIVSERIEFLELAIFLICAWMCYKKLLNFPSSANHNNKSNIIDYRCRFFKALMIGSLSNQ